MVDGHASGCRFALVGALHVSVAVRVSAVFSTAGAGLCNFSECIHYVQQDSCLGNFTTSRSSLCTPSPSSSPTVWPQQVPSTMYEQEQTQAAGSSNRQPHLPVKQPHRLRSGQKDFRMLHSCGSSCELISQGEWACKAIVALSACAGPREMLGSFLILHVAPSWSL